MKLSLDWSAGIILDNMPKHNGKFRDLFGAGLNDMVPFFVSLISTPLLQTRNFFLPRPILAQSILSFRCKSDNLSSAGLIYTPI